MSGTVAKKRVMIFMGTRPEGIKMAPLVHAFRESDHFEPIVCATAQHRALLDQVLAFFHIEPDFDLDLMQQDQDLADLTVKGLARVKAAIKEVKPDLVLVQGDTTTTFIAALAAFYARVPVGHVEAGLRTWDTDSPFPEEANRQMVTRISRYHFAPTQLAEENLRREQVSASQIYLTGNTGIDALLWTSRRPDDYPALSRLFHGKKMILMTSHRRENFGAPLESALGAVKAYAEIHPEAQIVYPVHPNPNVTKPVREILGNVANISLIAPVEYPELVFLLRSCHCVLTDSGGLQEEAPSFGKPVLVLRDTTERPEAIGAGGAKLVGCDRSQILLWLERLSSTDSPYYRDMAQSRHPFGDGTASRRIREILENDFFPKQSRPSEFVFPAVGENPSIAEAI